MRPQKTDKPYSFNMRSMKHPHSQELNHQSSDNNDQINSVMVQRMIKGNSTKFQQNLPVNNEQIIRNSLFKDSLQFSQQGSGLNMNYMQGQGTLDKLTK